MLLMLHPALPLLPLPTVCCLRSCTYHNPLLPLLLQLLGDTTPSTNPAATATVPARDSAPTTAAAAVDTVPATADVTTATAAAIHIAPAAATAAIATATA